MKRTLKIPANLYRTGSFTSAEDGTMRLSISSDEPYERYDWMNDERYLEVLDHSEKGVDLSRLRNGAALLFNHDRNILIGTLSEPQCEKGRCYVKAKLSDADDVKSYRQKIAEGVLKDTSIGYHICDDGEKIGERDGIPIYKFRFAIHEASLVTIPADTTVGVGRQRDAESKEFTEIVVNEEKEFDNLHKKPQKQTPTKAMPEDTTSSPEPKVDIVRERGDAVAAERKRVADIQELNQHFLSKGLAGRRIDASKIAADMIRDGKSVDDFQNTVIRTELPEVKAVETTPEIGMSEREKKSFSFLRAIHNLGTGRGLQGLEKEASETHAKLLGKEAGPNAFYIPQDVMRASAFPNGVSEEQLRALPFANAQTRALFTNVYSAAGAVVGTDLLGGSLIELLRNQMFVVQMGARSLSGLRGNVAIPRQTGGATASWLSEDSTASATNQTVGQLNLTPHKLMAVTAYTEQLLMQSSIDVENFVRQDLMAVIAIARDLAALHGTGVSGQPLGITNTASVATVQLASADSLTYAKAVAFETTVANANALAGKLGYLTTPQTRAYAKQLSRFANTDTPVWTPENRVNGYPAMATNQVASPGVVFGNWDDLILADWSDMAVLVDPYSLSLQSQIRVNMRLYCDNGIRHAASFAVGVL